ncbi:unnamed protein product, partial [Polarella glacialis]
NNNSSQPLGAALSAGGVPPQAARIRLPLVEVPSSPSSTRSGPRRRSRSGSADSLASAGSVVWGGNEEDDHLADICRKALRVSGDVEELDVEAQAARSNGQNAAGAPPPPPGDHWIQYQDEDGGDFWYFYEGPSCCNKQRTTIFWARLLQNNNKEQQTTTTTGRAASGGRVMRVPPQRGSRTDCSILPLGCCCLIVAYRRLIV